MIVSVARKYQQTKRAEQQDRTRRRIVSAAVELHRTEGPARTTMSAIAERAGVQRNTLYRHFPDERSILSACSAHYAAEHPMPVPDGWTRTADPASRLRQGLRELYAYWAATEQMTAQVVRDAEINPLVDEAVSRTSGPPLAAIRTALLEAWPADRRTSELEAVLDLAMSFRTWQSLVHGSGLSTSAAADLVTRLVVGAQP
jgi:AcrR family transcriptional regulator